jgi:hypothetical protein
MNRESIDWHTYYRAQAGGDYNYFKGSRFQEGYGLGGYYIQQGSGLGGMFRKFASWIIPIVKKYAVPSLKSGAEALGREALQSASNVAKDVLSGVNAKDSLTNHLSKSVDNLKEKAEKSLEGRGIKRKKAFKDIIILKKQKKLKAPKFKDIFSNA